jgi:GNAT superfamily N-acetyltransferase
MTPAQISAVLDATWPPATVQRHGPWTVRQGQGGGQRVNAATAQAAVDAGDLALAEAAMAGLGQPALFRVDTGDAGLDALLAAHGYVRHDPSVIYAAPVADLASPAPKAMAALAIWPPLGICLQIWADAGLDAGRFAVMDRAAGPKTSFLGRTGDRAAGAAFVACHGDIAMLHALEVVSNLQRQGTARAIMRMAAAWAQDQGAKTLCLAVTQANTAACALYSSLGMVVVGSYHYRKKR